MKLGKRRNEETPVPSLEFRRRTYGRAILALGLAAAVTGCSAAPSGTAANGTAANSTAANDTTAPGSTAAANDTAIPNNTASGESESDTAKTVTILQTSDIHGFLNAWDYSSDTPAPNGLSKAATLIKEERKNHPGTLLIDTGDISQGNMVERFRHDEVPAAVMAVNLLQYDAFIPGNHDFNYEFETLCNTIEQMDASVVSANIKKSDGSYFVSPYVIQDADGIKVAIIGFTTPQVPSWESANPDHYDNMEFTDPISEVEALLGEVEPLADLIVLAAHDGRVPENESPGFYAVADRFGDRIDAIFTGHEHAEYMEERNGVLMAGSGSHGKFLMKAVFEMEERGGSWEVADKHAELLSTAEAEPDPEFVKATASYHDDCVAEANAVIGTVSEDFLNPVALLPGIPIVSHEDTPLMDLVNKAQLLYTDADISMTNGFDPYANLTEGPFLYKDAVKLYPFDNTVKVLKVTGAELKEIMENWAGAYFRQWQPGDVTIAADPNVRFIGYDTFSGINYDIDVSKPVGERITNVTRQNKPLDDKEELRLAVNSFRLAIMEQSGSTYEVVYDSFNSSGPSTVRDMLIDYISTQGTVTPECDHNWKLIGADLEDPQKDLIYDMIRNGDIVIEQSDDGRNPNLTVVNADELREQGIIPVQ